MILEVKKWPESQDVMHNDGWFFIMAGDGEKDPLGNSAYARIIDNKNNKGDKMTAPSKAKGNRFERLVVNIAAKAGLSSKRAYASDGRSLGLKEDVDCLVGGYKVQCKTRKRIASWIKVPESCDVTAVKEDRGNTYIVIRYEDWLKLINEKGK